jgi:hypothetical protein
MGSARPGWGTRFIINFRLSKQFQDFRVYQNTIHRPLADWTAEDIKLLATISIPGSAVRLKVHFVPDLVLHTTEYQSGRTLQSCQ